MSVLGVMVGLATALTAPAPVARERPVFRAEIGLVVLQATVKNGRGELVTNLDRSAFRVYENGRAQEVSLFRRDDVPVSLGIALDNSGSMKEERAGMEAAALALVRASNPQDEVFVLNFGDKPRIDVPFTRDLAVLEGGIGRIDSIGGTAMRDAVRMGEEYLEAHAAHDRKVLLLVSDGIDNASVASADAIERQAEGSAIAVYAIALLDGAPPSRAGRARHELEELTERTGGLACYPGSLEEVGAIARELARQIRSQYTIGYSPANQALDGSYRKLRVVVRGSERLSVRTRAGYRAAPRPVVEPGRAGPLGRRPYT